MLPILLIFLLIQSFSATNEFPDLMQNVKVLWDGVDISRQLDARLTSSLDNQVDFFLLCGPYQIFRKGGWCKVESYHEIHYSETNVSIYRHYQDNDINLIGDYYRNNVATIICAAFRNLIPDFMDHKQYTWYGNYTCESGKSIPKPISTPFPKPNPKPDSESDSEPMGLYVVGAVIVMAVIGYFAFKIGQKKGAERSQGNYSSGAYKALGENNKKGYGGTPTYGNPFVQTA